ncbi:MAG TPA: phytanoyl-CoA dioxygenase family protein [Thermoanaerobaculia bacterium]|jgi:ectoine hydroxylase-related dioxygenase (phytanoyl-CoA dioxygenase family)|nr:phytanoyl-CoA dioxygenase family protein [Thermoanaerobaculia bacterium]
MTMWQEEGWLHVPSFLTPDEIALVNDTIAQLWRSKPGAITVDDLETGARCRMSELRDDARRHRIKINDLYLTSPAIRSLLLSPKLITILTPLLNETPALCNTLNLERSSAQDNHADSLYMTPLTPGGVVACWFALEPVRPDAGPLRLFPRSHLIPPYTFSNGLHHAVESEMHDWTAYIQSQLTARSIEPVRVMAAPGDLVVWHADLLHGADPITNPDATRKSLVAHYFPESDARRRGYAVREEAAGVWLSRRAQPVSASTRILSAIERRVQKLRGAMFTRRTRR